MLNKITKILLIIFALFLAVTFSLQFINIKTRIISSYSMYPALTIDDLIYVDYTFSYDNLVVGDVVVIKFGSEEAVHRLVEINETHFTTKGDNNDSNDSSMTKDKYLGKMMFKIPKGGKMYNPIYWIMAVGVYGFFYLIKALIIEFKIH